MDTVKVMAEGLGKRFRRRLIPAPPTFKEQVVQWLTRRGGDSEDVFWALEDVSFAVGAGEMFGIVGSNGSGKSTLLKMLAGIYRPDRGSLACRGKVVSLIELGAGFHPDLTGRENILINGLLIGLTRPEVRAKFDSIVAFAGLERFIDSPVRTYSSGMYMRLGFAIAAHADPEILLVDEILAVGDEMFQHQCLGRIGDLIREGRTIIYVSHDLGTVGRFCNRVLWLERGRVRAVGPPRETIDAYLSTVAEAEAARLMAEHHKMQVEEVEGGKRWGSRDVTIDRVTMAGSDGVERWLFRTGEPLTITLAWSTPRKVEDIIFGVAFTRDDGVSVYGTNTAIDGVKAGPVEGTGAVTFSVDSLSLLEGRWFLDVAAHRADGFPYDYQSRVHRFEVRSEIKDAGLARLPHRWTVKGR